MRPYILFIAMVLGGLVFTAIIVNVLDTRIADEGAHRVEMHRADPSR